MIVPNTRIHYYKGQKVIEYKPDDRIPNVETERKEVGALLDKARQSWRLPFTVQSLYMLRRVFNERQIRMDQQVTNLATLPNGFDLPVSTLPLMPEKVQSTIYPFQVEASDFLYNTPNKGAILNLSPGLGKTMVSLITAQVLGAKRILIICPIRLLATWQYEIQKWTTYKATMRHQLGPVALGVTITNFNTIVDFNSLYREPWDVIIVDESIKVKNSSTALWQAVAEVRAQTERLWLLSGFPVVRYFDDLYGQLALIEPKAFTSYWRFARTYCRVDESPWGDQVKGNRRNVDPQAELKDFMFVRNKDEVLKDLPPYIYSDVVVPMSRAQQKAYDELVREFITQLESGEVIETNSRVAQLIRLQQIVSSLRNFEEGGESSKLDTLLEMFELGTIPKPTIVWTHWKRTTMQVYNSLVATRKLKCGVAFGSYPKSDENIQLFQQGKLDVLVLSMSTGKYGLTFTNAQAMVYFDKTWDMDAYAQSFERVRRIGLTHAASVITLRTPNSTDELVENILAHKADSLERVSNSDLASMLRSLGQ